MFWLVLWATALITFLLLPICYREELRRFWLDRLCKCQRWNESPPARSVRRSQRASQEQAEAQENEPEQFHYRLSREQEDDIRACFLVDRLRAYSKPLSEKDIVTMESGSSSLVESSVTSDETPKPRAPDDLLAEDLEAGIPKVDIEDCDTADGGFTKSKAEGDNSNSGYDTSDDGSTDECMGEYMLDGDGECIHFVSVPLPGDCYYEEKKEDEDKTSDNEGGEDKDVEEGGGGASSSNHGSETTTDTASDCCTTNRLVPNGCAICLCPFDAEDKVTWSSNDECKHVFHAECILDWLKASGKRHLRRRRRNEQRTGVVHYANDPLLKITKFPMLCPCCRQVFVVPRDESENAAVKEQQEPEVPPAPAAQDDAPDTAIVNDDEEAAIVVPVITSPTSTTSEPSLEEQPNTHVAVAAPEEVVALSNTTTDNENEDNVAVVARIVSTPPRIHTVNVDDEEQGMVSPASLALSSPAYSVLTA